MQGRDVSDVCVFCLLFGAPVLLFVVIARFIAQDVHGSESLSSSDYENEGEFDFLYGVLSEYLLDLPASFFIYGPP